MMKDGIEARPVTPAGLAPLAKLAFEGADLEGLWQRAIARMLADATDTAAIMDLSTIAQLCGRRAEGLDLQALALRQDRLYRRPAPVAGPEGVRLLAFMAPGDFMANTPLEFLLQDSDVRLDMLYVTSEAPVSPQSVPEHDVAIVAIGESDANRGLLASLEPALRAWPRPVLNRPERIAALSRDGACALLRSSPGLHVPATARIDRAGLMRIAFGEAPIEIALPGESFPIIARPIASHAGAGLARLEDAAALRAYLRDRPEPEFFIAPFVDYRGADGLFRKYRVALIDGCPFACHMAVSEHWMVHYLNAGMREDAGKRREEARFMAEFERDFAARHAAALRDIAERAGLEYVALDCGETADGRLLVFEVDVAMIVHAMDPPSLFPYKGPQMRIVFDAFRDMLRAHSGRPFGEREPARRAA